jgi:hypothetical protein
VEELELEEQLELVEQLELEDHAEQLELLVYTNSN